MAHDHAHRDFICRDCGALVTCLSCLEIHAAQLPRGPAFRSDRNLQTPAQTAVFETIGVTNEFEMIEPGALGLTNQTDVRQHSLFN
jgi:hypothetical protein